MADLPLTGGCLCGGVHAPMLSSPFVQRRLPGTIRADGDAAVPVRRWQRVQWQ